jgi:glycosyltransferase involved in cell wall biosynthesis
VGDAALQVDPYDISGLVQAIRAIDGNPELRARLAHAGPRQAAQFSAERYAARLEALYARLGVPPVTRAAAPEDARLAAE